MRNMRIVAAIAALAAGCSVLPRREAQETFALPAARKETPWPGIISIFTKGGGYEGGKYLEAVKAAGFGAYHAGLENLEELRQHDVKLFLWGRDDYPTARALRDDPNILGYWARFPTTPEEWPELAAVEAKFREAAPRHPAFFALEMTWGHPKDYVEALRPRVIWYRHYLWEGHHLADEFHGARWAPQNEFIYLERVRRVALESGLPVVRWVHLTEPAKLRYTVSMSLVYGIRGFTWWQGWDLFELGKTDARGYPILNETGREVARLNRTMQAYSPVFAKARCVAAGHSWPWPLGYARLPGWYWAQPAGENVTMGAFLDREGNHYHVLGNRSIEKPTEARVVFQRPVERVSVMDKESGAWQPLAVRQDENGNDFVTVPLGVADVEMIWPQPVPDAHRAPGFGDAPRTFAGNTRCQLTPPARAGVIRYTLDGTEPTETSPAYAQPIRIDRTCTVRARFFHRDGYASRVSEAAYVRVAPVADEGALEPGVRFESFEGAWGKLPDFAALKPAASGQAAQLRIPEAYAGKENFGLEFTGFVRVPGDGLYTFATESDDGSRLFLGAAEVVSNDGAHDPVTKEGKADLARGAYPIRVVFFQGGGGRSLAVSWEGPGVPRQEIPASALLHVPGAMGEPRRPGADGAHDVSAGQGIQDEPHLQAKAVR